MRKLTISPVLLMSVLLACGSSDDEGRPVKSKARVYAFQDTIITRDWLDVTLNDGLSKWTFGSGDFTESPDRPEFWASREVVTRTSGTLTMEFTLSGGGGRTACYGSVSVGLMRDWLWTFDLIRARGNPVPGCADCVGVQAFRFMRGDFDYDSLYVVWRGKRTQSSSRSSLMY